MSVVEELECSRGGRSHVKRESDASLCRCYRCCVLSEDMMIGQSVDRFGNNCCVESTSRCIPYLKWSNTNEEVVKNIRHKWYRKASQTLTTAPVLLTTNMDEADEEALRDELAGRTGNTDTESEDEDMAMVAA
ncbi:hypothetical protein MVEN_01295700 [Mycena venus]|uniref:Uncharacterized protein n=1 Tax=Mycena venus TaxID=2733690 RepID=A0A8H7CWJ6_9AGAR|nr:hypothetical protein MVEN_01295700 [Mycena venus]